MKNSLIIIAAFVCLNFQLAHAQTLEKNTQWLSKQLNNLVKENSVSTNGKESSPEFSFKGCQMNMNIDASDKDFSFGMKLSWLLKDVQSISYNKEKDGNYALNLAVPADKMKIKLGFGGDNGINGNFNIKDSDKESKTNFSLNTKDEALVKEIKNKFEESVKACKSLK